MLNRKRCIIGGILTFLLMILGGILMRCTIEGYIFWGYWPPLIIFLVGGMGIILFITLIQKYPEKK